MEKKKRKELSHEDNERRDRVIDMIAHSMAILGLTVVCVSGILAAVFSTSHSTCSATAVITLQQWLLGFAVGAFFLIIFILTSILLGYVLPRQCNKGYGPIYNVIFVLCILFFMVWHWLAYDGLFGSGAECRILASGLWGVTLTIIVGQLAFVPVFFVFVICMKRAIRKRHSQTPASGTNTTLNSGDDSKTPAEAFSSEANV